MHGAAATLISFSLPFLISPRCLPMFSHLAGEMEEEEYREGRGEKTVAYLFAPRLRLRRRLRRPNRNRRVRFHLSGTDCERYCEEKVGSDRMFPLLLFRVFRGRSHRGFHSRFTLERSHHSAVQEKTEVVQQDLCFLLSSPFFSSAQYLAPHSRNGKQRKGMKGERGEVSG